MAVKIHVYSVIFHTKPAGQGILHEINTSCNCFSEREAFLKCIIKPPPYGSSTILQQVASWSYKWLYGLFCHVKPVAFVPRLFSMKPLMLGISFWFLANNLFHCASNKKIMKAIELGCNLCICICKRNFWNDFILIYL